MWSATGRYLVFDDCALSGIAISISPPESFHWIRISHLCWMNSHLRRQTAGDRHDIRTILLIILAGLRMGIYVNSPNSRRLLPANSLHHTRKSSRREGLFSFSWTLPSGGRSSAGKTLMKRTKSANTKAED